MQFVFEQTEMYRVLPVLEPVDREGQKYELPVAVVLVRLECGEEHHEPLVLQLWLAPVVSVERLRWTRPSRLRQTASPRN